MKRWPASADSQRSRISCADDYRLGELTRRAGLRTVLSEVVVETCVDEATLGDLVRHELRWLRTIRAVRPLGYALSVVTFGLPVAILGTVLAGGSLRGTVMLAITALARLMMHSAPRKLVFRSAAQLCSCCRSTTCSVLAVVLGLCDAPRAWRDARYRVARDGTAHPIP